MKRTFLTICILAGLFFACSKGNPGSSDPIGPGNGTHDTTPAPTKHDTTPTPPPPTETPGKSVVVGMYAMTIFLDNSGETDGWGLSHYVRLMDKDTSHYSAELINANKGNCKIDFVNNADSDVVFTFSNVYRSPDGREADQSDSGGNIQFHVYRKDGKNVKPGIKDIYMVLRDYPTSNIIGEGTILIGAYPGNRRKLTVDSLVNIIGRKSTQTLLNSDGF